MKSLSILLIAAGAAVMQVAGYTFPSFTYVATEWPSVDPSTDGFGYCKAPDANADFTAQLASSNLRSDIAANTLSSFNTGKATTANGPDGTCWWTHGNPVNTDTQNCVRPGNDIYQCKSSKNWGMSFDDGPAPSTLTLLDYLKANNLKATFFLVGSNMVKYPEIVQRIVNEGHEAGVHTWSHHPLTLQTTEVAIAELMWSAKAFESIVGFKPKYYRPPLGDIDDRIRAIGNAMGMNAVLWNADTQDYTTDTADGGAASVTSVVSAFEALITTTDPDWPVPGVWPNGVVTLEHDYWTGGADLAINTFIPFMMKQGFNPVPITTCNGDTAWETGLDAGSNSTTTSAAAPSTTASTSSSTSGSTATTSDSGSTAYGSVQGTTQVPVFSDASSTRFLAGTLSLAAGIITALFYL